MKGKSRKQANRNKLSTVQSNSLLIIINVLLKRISLLFFFSRKCLWQTWVDPVGVWRFDRGEDCNPLHKNVAANSNIVSSQHDCIFIRELAESEPCPSRQQQLFIVNQLPAVDGMNVP